MEWFFDNYKYTFQGIGAISTVLVSVLALYFANRKNNKLDVKIELGRLSEGSIFYPDMGVTYDTFIITYSNIGSVPLYIRLFNFIFQGNEQIAMRTKEFSDQHSRTGLVNIPIGKREFINIGESKLFYFEPDIFLIEIVKLFNPKKIKYKLLTYVQWYWMIFLFMYNIKRFKIKVFDQYGDKYIIRVEKDAKKYLQHNLNRYRSIVLWKQITDELLIYINILSMMGTTTQRWPKEVEEVIHSLQEGVSRQSEVDLLVKLLFKWISKHELNKRELEQKITIFIEFFYSELKNIKEQLEQNSETMADSIRILKDKFDQDQLNIQMLFNLKKGI